MENGRLPHQHDLNAEKLFDHMPAPAEFAGAAELFRMMSDGTRIRLFWLLCHCEECLLDLSAMMEVYYRAADNPRADALHHMIEEVAEMACPE